HLAIDISRTVTGCHWTAADCYRTATAARQTVYGLTVTDISLAGNTGLPFPTRWTERPFSHRHKPDRDWLSLDGDGCPADGLWPDGDRSWLDSGTL
ncbi:MULTISPECIES: hypothetical protein, partial [unclassified Candidatus Paralachnospira]|uniref:hypothetical protein n=1 Tax=unclassified Candidatus Paralachnospira TaxID=3099471 RepID=UPI003F8ECF4A